MSHVGDAVEPLGIEIATVGVMHRKASGSDPIAKAVNAALVLGAAVDDDKLFGSAPRGDVRLPTYPWQRRPFRLNDTTESVGALSPRPYHPLIGSRAEADGLEWHGYVDPETLPELEDHRVEGQVIMPGAGFVEMALAAAQIALRDDSVVLSEFEIVAPMIFAEDALREVTVRLAGSGNGIQVLSRPRLTQTPWQLHAQAKIVEGEFSPRASRTSTGSTSTRRVITSSPARPCTAAPRRRVSASARASGRSPWRRASMRRRSSPT